MSAPREPTPGEQLASLAELPAEPFEPAVVPALPIEMAAWFTRSRSDGSEQHAYRFANGYGASVVRGPGTYGADRGLFELAVITFDCPSGVWSGGDDWEITYETPLTGDVLGWLSVDDVAAKLAEIAHLPEATS